MKTKHLPLVGIAGGLLLLVVAARLYPGGTLASNNSTGFSVAENFISSLFAARALNGESNAARYVAIPALLAICVSAGVIFRRIAQSASTTIHRKTIEIGGIGATVYAFLVATPMHDLMVTIGLVFLLAALVALVHLLFLQRRWLLFGWGLLFVGLKLTSATIYYGDISFGALALLQKISLAVGLSWLALVYYTGDTDEASVNAKRDHAALELAR